MNDIEIWTQYNLRRTEFYKNENEENETKMDEALKNYLKEVELISKKS
jgi:hypothetical protein